MVRRLGVIAALALLVASVHSARAQAPAQDVTAEARTLFERGIDHADHERWVEALAAFRASVRLVDRATSRINIASILVRLGRHLEARRALIAFLERDDMSEPDRAQAAALLARALRGIRRVEVSVTPADASLLVDGELVDGAGATRTIELDPGPHRLEVRGEGFESEVRALGPSVAQVAVTLSPLLARLRVMSNVASARITVDGEDAGTGEAALTLSAGRYRVRVRADAYEPFERWLTLGAGQERSIVATLAPRVVTTEEIWESEWFWIVGAVTLAALIAGGIGLAVGLEQPGYDGGSLNDVLMPGM